MALNKQLIPVVFNMGVDTKTDKKAMNSSLLELENAYQVSTGELQMRNGYLQLSQETVGSPPDPIADVVTVDNSIALATFNQELVNISSDRLYSWAPQINKWADKGPIVFTDVNTNPVVANSYEQTSYDMATANGVAVYIWEDSRGGVRSLVTDLSSGAVLVVDTELNANGSRPKAIACQGFLFVFYYDSVAQELISRRIDTSLPSFQDEVTVAADINTTTPFYDVTVVGTTRMVVAYCETGGELEILYYLQSASVGGLLDGVPEPLILTGTDPDECLTIITGDAYSSENTFHLAWGSSTQGVVTYGMYANFTEFLPTVTVDAYSTTRNITGLAYSGYVDLYWEVDTGAVNDAYIVGTWLDVATNTANEDEGSVVIQRQAGLASKAFRGTNFTSSILVAHETLDGIQDTYFSVNNDCFVFGSPSTEGQIETKLLPQAAGGLTANASCVPSVSLVDANYYIPVGKKTRIATAGTSTGTLLNFNQALISFTTPISNVAQQLGGNLFIPGGYIKAYDGVSAVEQNFHLYPEQPINANIATSGNIANGTYLYILIWEWIDAQGQIFVSAPSIPYSVTVSGGPKQVTLTIPTLAFTDKKAPSRTPVIVSVYRTEDGGSTLYYKVSDDTAPVYNDLAADTVTFTDNISDADLISRPLLYTTGGVQDNGPAPAATLVRSAKNRLFCAGSENANLISYSKEYVAGESVSFPNGFSRQIDARGGDITALCEMDEKLIIFKENAIFYLTGDGPDDLGSGTFEITPVAADVGSLEPESIALTPDGLMFKSRKGIWLLTRGLQTVYLGDKVEEYNNLNVSSAVVVPHLNQVRFTTLEGTTLVYDHYFKQWSTFTNQAAVAAINWQGAYTFSKTTGEVWQEATGIYSDNNVPIIPVIGTAWIKTGTLSGFQRLTKAIVLGEFAGNHRLMVNVYYDYSASPSETFYYNMDDFQIPYGDPADIPYGDQGEVYGVTDGLYQFEIKPAKQRCQAIRFVISPVFPESTGTQAFKLTSLSLVIGTKKGPVRLPDSKAMTPS